MAIGAGASGPPTSKACTPAGKPSIVASSAQAPRGAEAGNVNYQKAENALSLATYSKLLVVLVLDGPRHVPANWCFPAGPSHSK